MSSPHERLFFALWPDEAVRSQLAAAAPAPSAAGRAVVSANLHVTLVFLGDVALDRLGRLRAVASAIHAECFELALTRIEVWNRSLVCLVPDETPGALTQLVARLSSALCDAACAVETREYRPHVTVIRERGRGHGKRASLMVSARDGDRLAAPIAWTINDFALVRSHPGLDGSRYEVLEKWSFSGG